MQTNTEKLIRGLSSETKIAIFFCFIIAKRAIVWLVSH